MSNPNKQTEGFIPLHGGYRNLITYQIGQDGFALCSPFFALWTVLSALCFCYDGTVYFTSRFFQKYDLTALEEAFLCEGGMRTRMAKVRTEIRNKRNRDPMD
jgi:four helix bundle suffix protein